MGARHLCGFGELAELDDRAVDAVQRRCVLVERALGLLEGERAVGGLMDTGTANVLLPFCLGTAELHHRVLEEIAVGLETPQHGVVLEKHLQCGSWVGEGGPRLVWDRQQA